MDAITQLETALTAEILAAATELKGVYGFADMPLKPHQLPGLVVDWGAESFEDVSNESPRVDGYVNRSIQADFILITTEVKRDFDRVTRPLRDKVLQVLFCADLPAIFTPLVSTPEKFQVEDGTGGGHHIAVRVEFTLPADDLAVISPATREDHSHVRDLPAQELRSL